MPQPPYAKLRASISGGAVQTGGLTIAGGATVQLSADPAGTPGASQYRYEIYDYPVGFTVPSGWSTDANNVYYSTAVTPPVFTVANSSTFGKYLLRLTLLNGVSPNPQVIPISQLIDESTALRVFSSHGLRSIGDGETNQFNDSWIPDLKSDLRTIDAYITAGGAGGSGVTAHGTLTGLGNDDHTQYLLVSGARAMSGPLAMGAQKITGLATPTAGTDAATKAYVDAHSGGGGVTAHGALTGLSADDHTQYILVSGSRAFVGDQSAGGHKLTNVATPTVTTDAANKAYVDAAAGTSGGASILPVACCSVGVNLTLSGEQTIDGVTTAASRVLVKDQTVPTQNGIYLTGSGAWARATDQATTTQFRPGVFFVIDGGTIQGGKFAALRTAGAVVVGTTAVSYAVSSGLPIVGTDDNKVSIAAGGALIFATITDLNVATSAGISGAKISPNFGGQQVLTTAGFVDTESGTGAERGFVSYQASTDGFGGSFVGKKSRGTASAPTAHAQDDALLDLAGRGYDGTAFYTGGNLRIVADAAGGTSRRTRVELIAHDGANPVTMSKTVPISPATTTNATPTAIYTVQIAASTLLSLGIRAHGRDAAGNEILREWTVAVRRQGSSNATQLGTSTLISYTDDVDAGLPDHVLNAASIDIRVIGKASTTYTWTGCEVSWRELP